MHQHQYVDNIINHSILTYSSWHLH